MSRTIPTINTARVILRAMRPEDFPRFAEIWAMPAVVAHITGKPRSKAQSWDAFLRNAGHWQVTGFGQWAVQQHGTPTMSGQTGFFYGSRGLGEDYDPYPEAGWVLSKDVQGRGIGTDAVHAAHDWFDRVISGPTVCMISPDNKPSLKLAQGLGYRRLREINMEGDPVLLMSRKGAHV
ncbi:MAG: GNAT family N-acetyltransferase [Pseudomonadota bacterium]